jgi:thioredoxin 1
MKTACNCTLVFLIIVCLYSCSGPDKSAPASSNKSAAAAKMTFVELGSVNCIPCKAMQPVMKAIEEKYGDQIRILFYDVWKADQKKYGEQYKIRLIPTQVFLDAENREIFRHEGFFPEAEIDKLLQSHGLKPARKESEL